MNMKTFITMMAACTVLSSSFVVSAAPKTMQDGGTFDAEYYASTYSDVVAVLGTDETTLYEHYKNCGKNEGRLPYASTVKSANDGQNQASVTQDNKSDTVNINLPVLTEPIHWTYEYAQWGYEYSGIPDQIQDALESSIEIGEREFKITANKINKVTLNDESYLYQYGFDKNDINTMKHCFLAEWDYCLELKNYNMDIVQNSYGEITDSVWGTHYSYFCVVLNKDKALLVLRDPNYPEIPYDFGFIEINYKY